jgi:hypothetical protein
MKKFFDKKLQFTHVEATGEDFSLQKKHPGLQKNEIY